MPITVDELWVYPVKSMAGIPLQRAQFGPRGIEGDREFMVIDERGMFVSQRRIPQMACIRTLFANDCLTLSRGDRSFAHPWLPPQEAGERKVRVWRDEFEAEDQGDEVAEWLSSVLETDVRLVRMPRAPVRTVNGPGHAPHLLSFADGYPSLVTHRASLTELESRLGWALSMRRFRPNIVVAGGEPFAEDRWRELSSAHLRFDLVKPCPRCTMINVDPQSGETGREPLATLTAFRSTEDGVMFGQNAVHHGSGELAVGEILEVSQEVST